MKMKQVTVKQEERLFGQHEDLLYQVFGQLASWIDYGLPSTLLQKYAHPENEGDLFRARLLVGLAWLSIFLTLPVVVLKFYKFHEHGMSFQLLFSFFDPLIAAATLILLKLWGRPKIVGFLSIMAFLLMIFFYLFKEAHLAGISTVWLHPILMCSVFLCGQRLGLLVFLMIATMLSLLYFKNVNLMSSFELRRDETIYFFELLMTLTVSLFFALSYDFLYQHVYCKAKIAEKEVKVQKEKALRSARWAALGEMAGAIAHEISNPLAIIDGLGKKLLKIKDAEQFSDQVVSDLNRLILSTARIAKITQSMRRLVKEEKNDFFIEMSLEEVFEDILNYFKDKMQKNGFHFIEPIFTHPIYLQCRPASLEQVLMNILNNAFDAISMQGKGWIQITIDEQVNGNRILIKISNSGPLVPKDHMDRIMNPFFTTKDVGKGSGLGLSISLKIMKEHGGDLYLDQNNSVTTFVMEIPKHLFGY